MPVGTKRVELNLGNPMTKPNCYSREQLRDYLLGELPDQEFQIISDHLDACSACEETVCGMDRESDTLMESLRTPAEAAETGSAYRLAAQRVVASWSTEPSSSNSPTQIRDYELLEPLAQGGMGVVYRARHVRLNRLVAVKVLPARWLQDPAVIARFEREMQAVGSLRHPAIVQATDGGDVDGTHFLVMELIEGLDGSSLLKYSGPLCLAMPARSFVKLPLASSMPTITGSCIVI